MSCETINEVTRRKSDKAVINELELKKSPSKPLLLPYLGVGGGGGGGGGLPLTRSLVTDITLSANVREQSGEKRFSNSWQRNLNSTFYSLRSQGVLFFLATIYTKEFWKTVIEELISAALPPAVLQKLKNFSWIGSVKISFWSLKSQGKVFSHHDEWQPCIAWCNTLSGVQFSVVKPKIK